MLGAVPPKKNTSKFSQETTNLRAFIAKELISTVLFSHFLLSTYLCMAYQYHFARICTHTSTPTSVSIYRGITVLVV